MNREKNNDADDIATPDTSRSNSTSEGDDDDDDNNHIDPERPISTPFSTDQSNPIQSSSTSTRISLNTGDDPDTNKGQSFLSSSSSESENDFAMVNQNDYPSDLNSTTNGADIPTTSDTINDQSSQSLHEPVALSTNNEQTADSTHHQKNDSSDDDDDDNANDDKINTRENLFNDQSRRSQFEAFASDQPLKNERIDTISADLDQEFSQEPDMQQTVTQPWATNISLEDEAPVKISTGDEELPWELDESDDEKFQRTNQAEHQTNSFFNTPEAVLAVHQKSSSISGTDSDDESPRNETKDEIKPTESENYDDYFTNARLYSEEKPPASSPSPKNVRFHENIEQVNVLTPKDSLDNSETTDTSDSDEDNDHHVENGFTTMSDRISDHIISESILHEPPVTTVDNRQVKPRPESEISLAESDDLPPPLPPLPPLHGKKTTSTENIPSKSTTSETKSKMNLRAELEITPTITSNPIATVNSASAATTTTTTEIKLTSPAIESSFGRSYESAILRPTSVDQSENVDPEDLQDVISCLIDNNQINIDGKTISPFKCVIGSAGRLNEDNQTAVIAIYGCWLPDHRLREYRYIMDQLFYYVYHKLEKLVTDDYILVYFHGATPKHRTPDLKFLRKCYQMINFRLRKNLRAVYVVHPTRWLRTIIALSRPFFSNKFYHKVHYLYTIAELERQFPRNQFSIPVIIEQTDWLYSQKYDRQNASINRSIERSLVRSTNSLAQESTA